MLLAPLDFTVVYLVLEIESCCLLVETMLFFNHKSTVNTERQPWSDKLILNLLINPQLKYLQSH